MVAMHRGLQVDEHLPGKNTNIQILHTVLYTNKNHRMLHTLVIHPTTLSCSSTAMHSSFNRESWVGSSWSTIVDLEEKNRNWVRKPKRFCCLFFPRKVVKSLFVLQVTQVFSSMEHASLACPFIETNRNIRRKTKCEYKLITKRKVSTGPAGQTCPGFTNPSFRAL